MTQRAGAASRGLRAWIARRSAGGAAVAAALLAFGVPAPASPQTEAPAASPSRVPWTLIDGLGYGGLGFGLGLVAAWDIEGTEIGPPDEAVALVAVTTAAGVIGGALLGRSANRALAAGRPLGVGHRTAVLAGAVLAGATLGALAAVPLINPEGEGTPLGTDEATVTTLAIAGAAVGSLFALTQARRLAAGRVELMPSFPGDGGVGLRVRVRR